MCFGGRGAGTAVIALSKAHDPRPQRPQAAALERGQGWEEGPEPGPLLPLPSFAALVSSSGK